jgi:hypothetical protein
MDDIFFVVCWARLKTRRFCWIPLKTWRFRHALQRRLDDILRASGLGWVHGAAAGPRELLLVVHRETCSPRQLLVVVHRETWLAAWEAIRAILKEQGLLRRPGPGLHVTLHDTLYGDSPTLWPLPQDVWRLDRLTSAELARLVDQLSPLVHRTLTARLHLDLLGDQGVLDTAGDAVDALQDLFDAALAAWDAALDLDA